MIQTNRIIRKNKTTGGIGIMSSLTIIVRNEQAIMTVFVIITRFADIPFIFELVGNRLICRRIERPTGT